MGMDLLAVKPSQVVSISRVSPPDQLIRSYAARSMSMSMSYLTTPRSWRIFTRARRTTVLATRRRSTTSCEAALKSSEPAELATPSTVSPAALVPLIASSDSEGRGALAVVGMRVRVKAPVKVYHVPRVPVVELTGMEGTVKQYVAVFRGIQLSAHLPFKVEFLLNLKDNNNKEMMNHDEMDITNRNRGFVKFSVHLKQDEFDFII